MKLPYNIHPLNEGLRASYQQKIDNLIKPLGSLGVLEQIALQVALIQETDTPTLQHPCCLLLAADHGVLDEGVSVSPKEISVQMTFRALQGDSGIGFLCRQHGFELKIVDAGVDYDFHDMDSRFYNKKVRRGTRNYRHEAAMTAEELIECLNRGAEMVRLCHEEGSNVVAFGELGMGNTSSAALWMHYLTGIPLEECVGKGSDASGQIVPRKLEILQACAARYSGPADAMAIMREFGGYEMAMAVGGMLEAAARRMVILVDGFIMTTCVCAAKKIANEVTNYCIFGHQGAERGHQALLKKLNARPILHLNLRLGEGSGAVCAYPIVNTAVKMLSEMGTFEEAKVTKYF